MRKTCSENGICSSVTCLCVRVYYRSQTVQSAVATARTSAEFASVTTVTMATVVNVTKRASTQRRIMTPVACTHVDAAFIVSFLPDFISVPLQTFCGYTVTYAMLSIRHL